jgi:serine/threonine protein kinase
MKQTRKSKRKTLNLKYMPKMIGRGRIQNMTTFKTVCNPKDANAKLIGLKSLKVPEESDDFVHVALAQMKDKELIIKLQSPGILLKRELEIHSQLKGQNNIIGFVCDFPCLFGTHPLTKPSSLCEDSGTPYHIIVMESINNNLSVFLENDSYTDEMFYSIIQQSGLSLLEIHINHGICHGDINKGNILLECGTPKEIRYKIGDLEKTVNTLGNEIIWIDFQRGTQFKVKDDSIIFQTANDEISLTYELMSKWVKNTSHKSHLIKLMNDVMKSETVEELFRIITS